MLLSSRAAAGGAARAIETKSNESSSASSASANNEVPVPPPASASPVSRTPLALHLLRSNTQGGATGADVELKAVAACGGGAGEVAGLWTSSDAGDWYDGLEAGHDPKKVRKKMMMDRRLGGSGFEAAGAVAEPTIETHRRRRAAGTEEGETKRREGPDAIAETAAEPTAAPGKFESCLLWLERPSTIGKIILLFFCLCGLFLALVLYQSSHHLPILPSWLTGKEDDGGDDE